MQNAAKMERLFRDSASANHNEEFHTAVDKLAGELTQLVKSAGSKADGIFNTTFKHFDLRRIKDILSTELELFGNSPAYVGRYPGVQMGHYSAIVLVNSRKFSCALLAFDAAAMQRRKSEARPNTTIKFGGTQSCIRVLKGAMPLRIWSVLPFDDATDFASDYIRACRSEVRLIEAGCELRLSEFEEAEYLAPDAAVVTIQTRLKDSDVPLSVICDAQTGKLLRTQARGQEASRLQMLATLVRLQGRTDAFLDLTDLLLDNRHFVRWHAMREMIRLDPARSLEPLKLMAGNDRQPSVRRAATQTIAMFFPLEQAADSGTAPCL